MNKRIQKICIAAMLVALSYTLMYLCRFSLLPAAPFLKYDPKDVVIVLGGFIFGPTMTLAVSVTVGVLEMITVSESGWIGMIMNILSSCAFSTTAALIYKKWHTVKGAVVSLACGMGMTLAVMGLWNYLITPVYMMMPREAVLGLLPSILLFNALKSGLNACLAFLLYRPVVGALRKAKLIPPSSGGKKKSGLSLILVMALLAVTCVLIVLVMKGII